jgi:hypothetical protein
MNEDYFEDDFDFNEEDNDSSFNGIYETIENEEVYDKAIDYFVRSNYKAIEENGIDMDRMRLYSLDNSVLEQLKSTIQFMIEYFIEREEYEKCAVLNKYMPELNEI